MKKVTFTFGLILVLSFILIILITIPNLESNGRYMMGFILIPLFAYFLLILFNKYGIFSNSYKSITKPEQIKTKNKMSQFAIEYDDKIYFFSKEMLFISLIGAILFSILIYFFLEININSWFKELITKQTCFLLDSLFNINSTIEISPSGVKNPLIYFQFINLYVEMTSGCIAIHMISLFSSLILFIPHSKNSNTNRDIKWRKAISLIIAISFLYLSNILRLVVAFIFAHLGVSFEAIHQSLFFLSSVIAAIIFVIILRKWLPEIFIAIYYAYSLYIKKNIQN